uniref:Uncharacterized protein n=1 Tax=Meloidogyne incognita TaxID=6306 RepID=A0A914M952_MELIC
MPPKRNRAAVLREWIAKIDGNSVYTTDGRVIFCEPCQQQAPSDQFFQFKQHNQTSKHQKNLQRFKEKHNQQKQQFIQSTSSNIPDNFTYESCSALISANIPFHKIENDEFRKFLEKHCGRSLPTKNTMYNYLDHCFNKVLPLFKNLSYSNIGLETIAQICQILSGHDTECNIPPDLIPYYKYAPITSVDVERSFSVYKSILADNRMKFTPKNLEMYLICNFNLS